MGFSAGIAVTKIAEWKRTRAVNHTVHWSTKIEEREGKSFVARVILTYRTNIMTHERRIV